MEPSAVTTFLFTDIEGSTRLWEQDPERMRPAMACHDAIARSAVESNHGVVVKMAGDGLHAAFDDPLDAIGATLQLQRALADPQSTHGVALKVRCGLHAGVDERRDNDFFGSAVNRAARIVGAAHGGQVLLSQAVAALLFDRLPAQVALRDLGRVRLRDLANPERLYQVVHPQLRDHFPALRNLEATPNNLPQQVTSFVGRERELAEVSILLKGERFVTLLGVGGIGKTRLSLQVAAELIDDYRDGVWLVELAALADPRLVAQAVASVLGVKEEAGSPVADALVKFVKDRQLLLLLDNCEHLVTACASLAKQLLQSGTQLKILASSREPLRVTGETTYPVPSLALPEASKPAAISTLMQCEAVRLFVDRASAAQRTFQITAENATAVSDICRRLDGIPLALELAAARVRSLSVENIAARLTDRFRLLVGGDQTTLPRQQTLRALIDWSYDLLTDNERVLLRRLCVFAGGWTLEAAEAVGAGGALAPADVLELLGRLVEKSLVVLEAGGERYHMLETVRHYAHDRLKESGEEIDARTRHLAFFVALAEQAKPALVGKQQAAWLARLDLERENLLAAHRWCDGLEGAADRDLALVHSVKMYWIMRGLLGVAYQLTVEALARQGAQPRSLASCAGLFDAGQLLCLMGRYQEAQGYLEESLAIAREFGDRTRIATVLQPLGFAALGRGDTIAAREYLQEALVLARELGDKREIAAALNALAQLYRVEGALDAAEPLYENVLALARELGDRESLAVSLLNLAMTSIGRGFAERARGGLLEVHAIVDETGSKPMGQSLLEVSAGLAGLREEWARAARFYGCAEATAAHTGLRRDPVDEAFLAPLIAKARAALGAEPFVVAEDAGRSLSYERALGDARAWLETID